MKVLNSIMAVLMAYLSLAGPVPILRRRNLLPKHFNWAPPGPKDVRSPCPALNSLANHGFLPNNGRNITMPLIIDSFKKGLNIGQDFAINSGTPALALSGPNGTWFDLDMLNKHNAIEHDGSLSRLDAHFGNDQPFHPPTFEAFLNLLDTTDYISIPAASKARAVHVYEKSKGNPDYVINQRFLKASLTQTALYMSVFGDPKLGEADSYWVELFFKLERLPVFDGWVPTVDETNATTLANMVKALNESTPVGVPLVFGPQ